MSIVHPCVAPAERWPLGIALLCSPEIADLKIKCSLGTGRFFKSPNLKLCQKYYLKLFNQSIPKVN
jgi:hypothetical protein